VYTFLEMRLVTCFCLILYVNVLRGIIVKYYVTVSETVLAIPATALQCLVLLHAKAAAIAVGFLMSYIYM